MEPDFAAVLCRDCPFITTELTRLHECVGTIGQSYAAQQQIMGYLILTFNTSS